MKCVNRIVAVLAAAIIGMGAYAGDYAHPSESNKLATAQTAKQAKPKKKSKSTKSQSRDTSWMQGNWRYRMSSPLGTLETRIGITENKILVMMNGQRYYYGPYSIDGNKLYYNRSNGCSDYILIDWTNRRLMADESHAMTRF